MRFDTPLRDRHRAWLERETVRTTTDAAREHRHGAATGSRAATSDVEYIPYGPPDEAGEAQCEIPAAFGEVELEYAAVRRGAGLFDSPQRATLRITGDERHAFLDSMLTQKLTDLGDGMAAEAFWLTRQGKIEADLLLAECGGITMVDLDVHQAAAVSKSLGGFIFTEDVEIADVTSDVCRVAVHGPMALSVLGAAAGKPEFVLEPLRAATVAIGGASVLVVRRDQTGGPGLELTIPRAEAPAVWDALLATDHDLSGGERRVRPIGWFAYNVARVEGGAPLFNVDFGATNLPNESGVLRERVSFNKGCYLGQEIVARIENLGQPKHALVGLRMENDLLPVAQGQVFEKTDSGMGEQIGIVTSSTISPMLGARPIAFAMLRAKSAEVGATVLVNGDGEQGTATIGPLRFWPPAAAPASETNPPPQA